MGLMNRQFKLSDIKDLWRGDTPDGFELVEEGDFVQDGKYQVAEMIFLFEGKHYAYYIERSGSPFTDWTYEWEWLAKDSLVSCSEVQKVEVTTTEWKNVDYIKTTSNQVGFAATKACISPAPELDLD
jgi:hypothetical protein